MSWRHSIAAGELPIRNPSQKAVLNALAHHAYDYTGRCYPSIERLALFTGLGRRAVQYALKELVEMELVIIQERAGKASIYEITIPGIEPLDQGGAPNAQGGASGAHGGAAGAPESTLNGTIDARVVAPLPDEWEPKPETIERIKKDDGLDDDRIHHELRLFKLKNEGQAVRSPETAFRFWCARVKDLRHEVKVEPKGKQSGPAKPVDQLTRAELEERRATTAKFIADNLTEDHHLYPAWKKALDDIDMRLSTLPFPEE